MWCEIIVESDGGGQLSNSNNSLSTSSVITPSLTSAGGHEDFVSVATSSVAASFVGGSRKKLVGKALEEETKEWEAEKEASRIADVERQAARQQQIDDGTLVLEEEIPRPLTPSSPLSYESRTNSSLTDETTDEEEDSDDDSVDYEAHDSDVEGIISEEEEGDDFVVLSDEELAQH